jgi:predicted acylesterase/phospholipase RssA
MPLEEAMQQSRNVRDVSVRRRCKWVGRAALTMLACLSTGCLFPAVPNEPLSQHDRQAGYRLRNLPATEANTDDVFVCLAFSGGGTRAAALAYGVLEALNEVPVASREDGAVRTLYDEVDVVSSVSGGSFTALAMAHFGKSLFDHEAHDEEGYKARFLYRDI